jgi:hypothetical protein
MGPIDSIVYPIIVRLENYIFLAICISNQDSDMEGLKLPVFRTFHDLQFCSEAVLKK